MTRHGVYQWKVGSAAAQGRTVEAVRFDGSTSEANAISLWLLGNDYREPQVVTRDLVAATIDGQTIKPGEYVVRYPHGSFGHYSKESFEKVFEPVSEAVDVSVRTEPTMPRNLRPGDVILLDRLAPDLTVTSEQVSVLAVQSVGHGRYRIILEGGEERLVRSTEEQALVVDHALVEPPAERPAPPTQDRLRWADGTGKSVRFIGMVHRVTVIPNEDQTGWIVGVNGVLANMTQSQAEFLAHMLLSGPNESQKES